MTMKIFWQCITALLPIGGVWVIFFCSLFLCRECEMRMEDDLAISIKPEGVEYIGYKSCYEMGDDFEGVEMALLSEYDIKRKLPHRLWQWGTMDYWIYNKTNNTDRGFLFFSNANTNANTNFFVFTRPINK